MEEENAGLGGEPQVDVTEEAIEEAVSEVTEDENEAEGSTTTVEEEKVPLKALQEERRKRQEYEKKLLAIEERLPPKQATITDLYERDPQGVTAYINRKIEELVQADPYANAGEIERLRDTKQELREQHQRSLQTTTNDFVTDLRASIPNFDTLRDQLTDYAVNKMGYDMEDLAQLTNPAIVGKRAALKVVKDVHAAFAKEQAAKTVTAKAKAKAPAKVESPGDGIAPPQTDKELATIRKKAEETGNWSEYYRRIGFAT